MVDFLNTVLEVVVESIFRQPPVFLGFIALVGLLLQRKDFNEVLKGTMKTIIGVIILMKSVDIIVASIEPVASAFGTLFSIEGNLSGPDWLGFLGSQGSNVGLVMLLAFFINILIARFTKLKNIFLTGHILFWMAYIVLGVLVDTTGLSGVGLIAVASIILGLYMSIVPALLRPFVRDLTGSDEFTIGHSTVGLSIIGGYIGKWFGDKSRSTEDIKLPKQLEFFREAALSTGLVMFLIYIAMMIGLGPDKLQSGLTWKGAFTFALVQGLTFGAGITILLTGVRMMLAEIIPAFRGIAQKIVPDAIPALDCPMVFPYAPTAVIIGFSISMITSLITIFIFGLAGFSWVLLPLIVACFFDVGPAAVFGNASGGLRGAVLASVTCGVLLIVFQALSLPFVTTTVGGFLNLFGGNDFSLIAIVVGFFTWLINLLPF